MCICTYISISLMYRLKIFDYLFRTENTLPIFSTNNCKNFTIFIDMTTSISLITTSLGCIALIIQPGPMTLIVITHDD